MKGDNPNAKNRVLSILDRNGYLIGVLSAILVLISWIGKEAISGNLREAQKRLSAIAVDRQNDRIDDILLQIHNVEKDLVRAEHRANDQISYENDYFGPVIWSTQTLDRIQLQRKDYQDLLERVDRLRGKAVDVPLSNDSEQRLRSLVKTVHSDSIQLNTCLLEYGNKLRNTIGGDQISRSTVPKEKADLVVALISNYRLQTKDILETQIERLNELLAIREEVYRAAQERESLLASFAGISSFAAAFIFVLGSALGIYGTYRAAKEEKAII